MEIAAESKTRELAKEMAQLSCELGRTCNAKESYFASLFNLSPAEFKCLRLFEEKKVLAIKELTAGMRITPGRVTHILTTLEEKKLITRKTDPEDKRNVIIYLTPKSEPFIKNLTESHIKIHEDILERIDEDKRETVIAAMNDLITALKDWYQNK